MAMRGAVTACLGRNRISSSSLLRVHFINTTFHHSSNNSRLTHFPLSKTGYRYPIRAIHEATTLDPSTPRKGDEVKKKWEVKMLFDGDCPLCLREVDMLRERNKRYGTIEFVDISSDKYSPEENHGLDYETAMGRIHAVMADGTIVTDVEAFRKLYEAVGLGWVYAITKYKPLMPCIASGPNTVFKLQAGHQWKRFWKHGRRAKVKYATTKIHVKCKAFCTKYASGRFC